MKLNQYDICGNILHWTESFLTDRTRKPVVGGEQSSPAPVTPGVSQGTALGPLLFLVYSNDLPLSVYCIVPSNQQTTRLNYRKISTYYKTGEDRLMDFNPDKSEVIIITNKRKIISGAYFIHQQHLKETDKAKYTRITIDIKL